MNVFVKIAITGALALAATACSSKDGGGGGSPAAPVAPAPQSPQAPQSPTDNTQAPEQTVTAEEASQDIQSIEDAESKLNSLGLKFAQSEETDPNGQTVVSIGWDQEFISNFMDQHGDLNMDGIKSALQEYIDKTTAFIAKYEHDVTITKEDGTQEVITLSEDIKGMLGAQIELCTQTLQAISQSPAP